MLASGVLLRHVAAPNLHSFSNLHLVAACLSPLGRTSNPKVVGSIPTRPTSISR
jgi:hypothetical protein